MTPDPHDTAESFWEDRYSSGQLTWSGNPNTLLVDEASDLAAGTALDLGCGQGDDAIWLASRGWRVTAVDVSATALERASERAEAAGVADAIAYEQYDLATTFPAGDFDLISACYLHSPVEFPRGQVLRAAADAVVVGGMLLVVGHAGSPPWAEHNPDVHFPTPDEVLDDLELTSAGWEVQRSAFVDSPTRDPDGTPATRPDNVLKLRRLAR